MNIKKKLILSIISISISLVIAELGLRFFTPFPIHSSDANTIPDEKLSYRMDPDLSGIDENGFRNPKVLVRADVVTLGDSQTYGYNVDSEESWPQQLSKMSNLSVYNYGVGGYGPPQYYLLFQEAVELKPKFIIIGLYLKNDLNDVCHFITTMDYWNEWAKNKGYDTGTCFQNEEPVLPDKLVEPVHINWWGKLKSSFKQTQMGSLLVNARRYVYNQTAIGSLFIYILDKPYDESNALIIKDESNPTVMSYEGIINHGKNTDLDEGYIDLGIKITMDMIKELKIQADLNDIDLVIMLIPSKESVYFQDLLDENFQLPSEYYELIDHENKLTDKFSSFFKSLNIKYVDVKPYLVLDLHDSKSIFPNKDESHPLEAGYNAYAKAVFDIIIKKKEPSTQEN